MKTLLGNRLLIKPVKKSETEGGIIIPDSATSSNITQQYEISFVGTEVEEGEFTVGQRVIVSDAVVVRGEKITINEQEHVLITPSNVIGLP